MQRGIQWGGNAAQLLAAIAAMGLAGIAGATGYSAEPQEADVGLPNAAAPGVEISVQPPRDLKDVALAAKPMPAERRPAIAANPKHPERLVLSLVTSRVNSDVAHCAILRSGDGGRTWSAPILLPDPSGDPGGLCSYDDVAYAPDGKRVYAAYTDGPVSSTVLVSSSTDDGATWQKPAVAIDDPYGGPLIPRPSISTPVRDGDAKWVYLAVQSRFADPGTNISLPARATAASAGAPSVGSPAGDSSMTLAEVAWPVASTAKSSSAISNRLWVRSRPFGTRRSSDHGTNFDGPAAVAIGYAGDADVKIGKLGVAHVAFAMRSANFTYDIAYVWSAGPPYTTWSEPVTVNDAAFDATIRRRHSPCSVAGPQPPCT